MFGTLFHSEAAVPAQSNLVAIILRVSLAVIFLMHGLEKIVYYDGGADWLNRKFGLMAETSRTKPEGQRTATQIPTELSFPAIQLAVAWGEFLGGLALAIGMLTRFAAFGEILIQIGALVLVTAPLGFQLHGGGFEYQFNLALIVMCLSLVILGPGHWSVDRELSKRRTKRAPAATVSVPETMTAASISSGLAAEHMAPGASS